MARRSVDVYTEWRGGTCRVKWWTGEYLLNGRKKFDQRGGFLDEDTAYKHGQHQIYELRHRVQIGGADRSILMTRGERRIAWTVIDAEHVPAISIGGK